MYLVYKIEFVHYEKQQLIVMYICRISHVC